MAREIKFRAWNTKGNYMCSATYGDWVSFDGVPYTEASKKYDTPNIEIKKVKDYVLMQFTGLLDKNGKEIYDQDIIGDGEMIGIVLWNKEGFWDIQGLSEIAEYYLGTITPYCRVLGNLYENSDLLK